jgi:hypothetical protein
MSASDKRKQRRIPADLWMEVDREGDVYFQRASNLSVGGAYFSQTIPLPISTVVELKFSLPGDAHEICCKGEIVTAKDLGMGVSFVGIDDADRKRIASVIDAHEKHEKNGKKSK